MNTAERLTVKVRMAPSRLGTLMEPSRRAKRILFWRSARSTRSSMRVHCENTITFSGGAGGCAACFGSGRCPSSPLAAASLCLLRTPHAHLPCQLGGKS